MYRSRYWYMRENNILTMIYYLYARTGNAAIICTREKSDLGDQINVM